MRLSKTYLIAGTYLKHYTTTYAWKRSIIPIPVMEVIGMVKTYRTGTNRRSEVPKATAMGCAQRPSKAIPFIGLITTVV